MPLTQEYSGDDYAEELRSVLPLRHKKPRQAVKEYGFWDNFKKFWVGDDPNDPLPSKMPDVNTDENRAFVQAADKPQWAEGDKNVRDGMTNEQAVGKAEGDDKMEWYSEDGEAQRMRFDEDDQDAKDKMDAANSGINLGKNINGLMGGGDAAAGEGAMTGLEELAPLALALDEGRQWSDAAKRWQAKDEWTRPQEADGAEEELKKAFAAGCGFAGGAGGYVPSAVHEKKK